MPSEAVEIGRMGTYIETARLLIRPFDVVDAPVMLRLLNEPSFIENIADRGVRTVEQATQYLAAGPIASYVKNGHGMYLVESRETGEPAGMCGLLRRAQFADVDVGYSFFPEFWRRGYATESVLAVMEHGYRTLGFERIIALVNPRNVASARLLEKIGFTVREKTLMDQTDHAVLVYEHHNPLTTP